MGLRRRGLAISEQSQGSTGGRIGERLVRYAGATAFFKGAVVTYDYPSRTTALGIPQELLQEHGTVSEPVVRAMAEAVRGRFGSTVGLASTGIAGPTGNDVGLVWLALADATGTRTAYHRLPAGTRGRHQSEFTRLALEMLRDAVLESG